MKILIIGGGNMGLTYAKSFIEGRICSKEDLMLLEKSEQRSQELQKQNIGTVFANPADCIPNSDLIILAVKPQDINGLFSSIKNYVQDSQLILSIMAGVKIENIKLAFGVNKIIRAMPNLPAQIGMGMTGFTSTEQVSRIELITVQNLLNTTGKTIYLENESSLDAITAISGSGPAYVFFFMNAMIKAAENMGFNASEAELLVAQTFMGSIHLENRSNFSCEDWISKVASKGGTTEAALHHFNSKNLQAEIINGLNAALNRSIELGKLNE